jgi:energy-coupling factor transporter ATP-binding protein EcfA2/predicted  nucleic acid-binding Zn-ribbon protein
MRIRAVRLREVGCFAQPVAIEGLSGALDVLVGRNEIGKSTILRALQLGLFKSHAATGIEIEALRPYSGGAPLIEIDIDVGAERWRIRKQFLAGRSAVLTDLITGRVLARGKDAEAKLADVLDLNEVAVRARAGLPGRFGLIFLDQKKSLQPAKPDEDGRSILGRAIEQHIAVATGAAHASAVRVAAEKELEALVSKRGPRAGGRLEAALKDRDRIQKERDVAAAAAAAATGRLERLAALRLREAALSDPRVRAERAEVLKELRARHALGREAREKLHHATERRKTTQQIVAARRSELGRFDADTVALVAAEITISEIEPRLAAIRATPALLEAARRAQDELTRIDAALSASLPKVSVTYAAGGRGKVRVGGRSLDAGEIVQPGERTLFEIDGIGTLTVEPGRAGDVARLMADAERHRAARDDALRAMEVFDITEADHQITQRRKHEVPLQHAQATVRRLAPGLPAPAERLAHRDNLLRALADGDERVRVAAIEESGWRDNLPDETQFAALQAQLSKAEENERRAAVELRQIQDDALRQESALARDRHDDVDARLAELEEALAAAANRVRAIEEEVESLALLVRAIEAIETEARDAFLAPVTERIGPYLDLVLPGSRLALGDSFAAVSLARAHVTEPLERLSDGTQEQVAVLARLGFARLLADTGWAAPMVLDDALVYSDDERLAGMFRALEKAAQVHQVIVLTCRARAFDGLGGRRLDLEPWQIAA